MKVVDFKLPTRLDEAQKILKDLGPKGIPVAGGTSFVFMPDQDPRTAVDITRLGLSGITRENGSFSIGAVTPLAGLQKHHEAGWVLDRVAVHLASQQIRNMSTLGGNIARVFPWSDFPIALLALNASMTITGQGKREMSADEYFSAQPSRLFGPGELLTSIKVPALAPGSGFGYRKETQTMLGFSLTTAAVFLTLEGKKISGIRVALGSGIPFPSRWTAVEQALQGQPAGESIFNDAVSKAVESLKFKSNGGMSESYIAHLTVVTAIDALTAAWQEAKEVRT